MSGSSTMSSTLKTQLNYAIRAEFPQYKRMVVNKKTLFFWSGLLPRGHHVFHHRLPPRLRRLLRRPVQLWRLLHDDAKLLLLWGGDPPPSSAAAGQRHVPRSRRLQRWESCRHHPNVIPTRKEKAGSPALVLKLLLLYKTQFYKSWVFSWPLKHSDSGTSNFLLFSSFKNTILNLHLKKSILSSFVMIFDVNLEYILILPWFTASNTSLLVFNI